MNPPEPTKPLSSDELERDAKKAGIVSDETVEGGSDPHLPASESDAAAQQERKGPSLERDLTNLPPG